MCKMNALPFFFSNFSTPRKKNTKGWSPTNVNKQLKTAAVCFINKKNSNSTWLALWFRLSLSFFNLCHSFFNTRSKNEQCTENLHFCGQREKQKFHPKTKNMFIKAWDSLQKTIPLPFLQLCIPQFENDFSFLTTKKNSFFQFCLFLIKREKLKKS